jgi:hypothetical protein
MSRQWSARIGALADSERLQGSPLVPLIAHCGSYAITPLDNDFSTVPREDETP